MIIEQHVTTGFFENTWIVGNESTREAIIIDPGDDSNIIIHKIEKLKLTPRIILATHSHPDHIGAVNDLQNRYNIPFGIHEFDKSDLENISQMAQLLGIDRIKVPKVSITLAGGQIINICGFRVEIIHTPGHTPGSVCFSINGVLFVGDTIFKNSIGRTDLPGGSFKQLKDSLLKISKLPKETTLYPGHGEVTTIEKELNNNPFLKDIRVNN